MPPPKDADRMIAKWKELGCPPIGLGQGITIANLERWLYPAYDITRPKDQLAIIREFLYLGQRRFDDL
jgi:hypothetical protein